MIELPIALVSGILGAGHCLGMCGPLAVAIGGGADHWRNAWLRQLSYTGGRIFTYAVLGAVAGYCGERFAHYAPSIVNVPAILAVAAGVFLLYQGIAALGYRPFARLARWSERLVGRNVFAVLEPLGCAASNSFAALFRARSLSAAFSAGIFTGLIPCGLLYGMIALAVGTRSVLGGASLMALFGAGTAPGLILVGLGSQMVALAWRKRLHFAAAWCLVVTALLSIARGASHLSVGERPAAGCPLCHPAK